MRLICPNCDAQYEVADNVIPDDGRDVQCSNCGTTWFQRPEARAFEPEPATAAGFATRRADRPAERPKPEPKPAPVAEKPAPPPKPAPAEARAPLSQDAASILRDELERERRQRPTPPPPETQQDMALEPPPLQRRPDPEPEPSPRRPRREPTSRDLLPDIEEINSTLTATSARRAEGAADAASGGGRGGRAAFRSGFVLSVLIAVVALGAYVMSPQIVERFPDSAPRMASYVKGADSVRNWLDGAVDWSVERVSSAMGSEG